MAEKVEQGAVKFVGAGAAAQRNLRARQASEFRDGARRLHPEFLQRIERDQAVQAAERRHARQGAARGLRGQSARAHALLALTPSTVK